MSGTEHDDDPMTTDAIEAEVLVNPKRLAEY